MQGDSTAEQTQKVAVPAYLLQRLLAFRIGSADRQSYVVRDKLLGKTYDFEPWQFFVLEVLPGCEDRAKLSTIFEDRFGYQLPRTEVELLFASVADAGLFNEDAAGHPLLKQFSKRTYVVEDEHAKVKSFRALVADGDQRSTPGSTTTAGAGRESSGSATGPASPSVAPAADEVLPAGMQDAIGFDPRAVRRMWVLFDPRPLLARGAWLLTPVKYGIYLLPLVVFAAVSLALRHSYLIREDVQRLLGDTTFLEHALFSLVSVNLLVTLATAVIAFNYRATVSGIGIVILMSFLPRFAPRITHVEQLSRAERMWLHAAPLLLRVALSSVGILTWYTTRGSDPLIAEIMLALAVVSLTGLIIAANPLIKSGGYHLLAAFANEPHLRGKSYRTLLHKLRGGTFREAEEMLLATYALASLAFVLALAGGAVLVVGSALHEVQLGGGAIAVAVLVGGLLLWRMVRHLAKVEAAYERSVQFDRWRRRALPLEPSEESPARRSGIASYLWRATPLCLGIVAFLPYPYSPGGEFTIYPSVQQVITADVSGVVTDVYFSGGETLKKGTVIAGIAHADNQAQVDVLEARMTEQQAVVEDLKARPRRAEVALAEQALKVEMTRAEFSKSKAERVQRLYDAGTVSLEELETARREQEVDQNEVLQKRAALEVARLGATPDEIAAAQAKWESLRAERDSYLEKIQRAVLVMPFDGRLLTLHLQQKGNTYYNRGEPFAVAESVGPVTAEIQVPESDMEYVAANATVRARPTSYSSRLFTGKVAMIDWNITEQPSGNFIKVIAVVENPEDRLRNGMKGYAKIEGPSLPVWKAFALPVVRFFNVQVWSWIP